MSIKRNMKNILSLFSMEFISRLISFFAVTYLARVLGNEGFGLINIGQAVLTYVVIAGSAGLNLYGTRKTIAGDQTADETASNVIVTKLLLTFVFFAAAVIIAYLFTTESSFYVIFAYCLFAFPSAFLLEWYYQGLMKMELISSGRIIGMLVYYILILIFVSNPNDAAFTGLAWTFGGIVNAIFLIIIFQKSGHHFKLHKNFSIVKLLKETLSLGVSSVISQVVAMFPVIFLGIVAGASETGIYSAAYKVIVLLLVLDRVFSALFFPKVTSYYNNSSTEFHRMFNLVLKLIVVIGLSVLLIIIIGADPMITILFGDSYIAAGDTLRILTAVFYLSLVSSAFTFTLIAMNKENDYTKSLLLGMAVFLLMVFPLNFYFGANGAAIAYVLFQLASLLFMIIKTKEIIQYKIFRTLVLPAAVGVLFVAVILSDIELSLTFQILLAALIGIPSVILTAGFSINDLKTIKRAFI